jgi:phage tail sheath protein FI
MMGQYKTPGVYIVEKSAFPNSVVEVATAVPAFIGYTEKASNKGKTLLNKAWRISSMSEFISFFGGPPKTQYEISNKAANQGDESDFSSDGKNYWLKLKDGTVRYYLYHSMMLFFQNGGGACYIVSVDSYGQAIDKQKLSDGIDVLLKEQEPTMVVIPDAMSLKDESECIALQQAALMHCGKVMRNRFAILDVFDGYKEARDSRCIDKFRNDLGTSNLDFAAAYYPWLNTSIVQAANLNFDNIFNLKDLAGILKDELTDSQLADNKKTEIQQQIDVLTSPDDLSAWLNEKLDDKSNPFPETLLSALKEDIDNASKIDTEVKYENVKDKITSLIVDFRKAVLLSKEDLLAQLTKIIEGDGQTGGFIKENQDKFSNTDEFAKIFYEDKDKKILFLKGVKEDDLAYMEKLESKINDLQINSFPLLTVEGLEKNIKSLINNLKSVYADSKETDKEKKGKLISCVEAKKKGDSVTKPDIYRMAINRIESFFVKKGDAHKSLSVISPMYGVIMQAIRNKLNLLPPSAAMAGVYTMVDNSRGVWKAPANVSLNAVISPAVDITHAQQEDLNVTTAGKSINAIRTFIGEGTLVWGARTLDGNSLDWRYINVRRTMLMLEESIKLATKAYVFEPNVSTTWVTIRSMISNFLTNIWKRGGLAGATPDDAFGVFVGLGETMTPQDILDGMLKVTVLVALSRPAEFIEITFQQQMQKS